MALTLEQQILFAVWLFAVGGCVGSFLNVVIYRVPAGLSIVSPGSRCPKCLTPIRARDNIPVVSWLLLRGKCRDCALPISGRYPCIEALVAAIFLLLYVWDLVFGYAAISIRLADDLQSPTAVEMGAVFLLHAVLASTLVATMMIEYDNHPVSARICLPVICLRLVLGLVLPRIDCPSGFAAWLLIALAIVVSLVLNSVAPPVAPSHHAKTGNQDGVIRASANRGRHAKRSPSPTRPHDPTPGWTWAWVLAIFATVITVNNATTLWLFALLLGGLTVSRGLLWQQLLARHKPFAILAIVFLIGLLSFPSMQDRLSAVSTVAAPEASNTWLGLPFMNMFRTYFRYPQVSS